MAKRNAKLSASDKRKLSPTKSAAVKNKVSAKVTAKAGNKTRGRKASASPVAAKAAAGAKTFSLIIKPGVKSALAAAAKAKGHSNWKAFAYELFDQNMGQASAV